MKMTWVSVLVLFLLQVQYSKAADKVLERLKKECSVVRLDLAGGSLQGIIPLNQKSVPSCSFHVIAQMYDAWRVAHQDWRSEERTSPGYFYLERLSARLSLLKIPQDRKLEANQSDSALVFNSNQAKSSLNSATTSTSEKAEAVTGGYTRMLRGDGKTILDKGSCPWVGIPQSQSDPIENLIPHFINYTETYKKWAGSWQGRRMVAKTINSLNSKNFSIHFTETDLDRVLWNMSRDNYVDALLVIKDLTCKDHKRLKTAYPFQILSIDKDYKKFIMKTLNLGPKIQPIGAEVLVPGLLQPQNLVLKSLVYNDHDVLIVGRQPNLKTRKCELLIRNSWGPDAKEPYKLVNRIPEGDFDIWIDIDDFIKHTLNVYTFVDKN